MGVERFRIIGSLERRLIRSMEAETLFAIRWMVEYLWLLAGARQEIIDTALLGQAVAKGVRADSAMDRPGKGYQ